MTTINAADIRTLVVACDAGMGSSAMLASTLRKELRKQDIEVRHTPVDAIPADADVVVCHAGLAARARATAPDKVIVPFRVFLGDPAVKRLVTAIKNGGAVDG